MKTKHVSEKAGPSLEAALQYNYLTASAIAKIIGVTPQTVNNWRRNGLIPASIEVQDTVRYNLDHVRKALDALTKEKELARGTPSPEIEPHEQFDPKFASEEFQSTQAMQPPLDGPILAALVACLPIYIKAIADELQRLESSRTGGLQPRTHLSDSDDKAPLIALGR